jgi:hypothetical protein
MINLKSLALHFEHQTGCSPEKAEWHTKEYVRACAQSLIKNYYLKDVPPDQYAVALQALRTELGDIIVAGKRYYVFTEFQSMKQRILVPVEIGSNIKGKISMAKLNYSYEDILAAAGTPEELFQWVYAPYADEEHDTVPIDLASLDAFIRANKTNSARDIEPTDQKYNARLIQELDRNLKSAEMIYKLAKSCDGYLPHFYSNSPFGRKYYKGPNLQTAPKIVRHAALGHCYEYDLESNVFAWKYTSFKKIAQQYDISARFPATLEYLDHKDALRRRLAREVFGTEDDWALKPIKQCITAIGFGAPARVTGYRSERGRYEPTALNTHITSVEKLKKFLDDKWVKEFIAEQQTLNEVIFEVAKPFNEVEWRATEGLVDGNRRLKKNSVISYLYQRSERALMEAIWTTIEPYEPVLMIHDCIYTKKPVPLRDLREKLVEYSEYYKISKQEHQPFAFDEELIAHRERIREEERLARGYVSPLNDGPDIQIAITPRAQPSYTYNSDSTCADGSGYNGMGYENYNPRDDYGLEGEDEDEIREYQRSRDRILNNNQYPDWVKQRIGK